MPALLGAGLLILDVVASDPNLDETTDQVPDVRIATVPGIGIGDDERPVVDLGGRCTLGLAEAGASEALVPVRREQSAHDWRSLVWYLGQRITCQVGPRVLGDRSLGRRSPAAEIDTLDAHALQGHRLTGRVRAEGRDLL